MTDARTHALWSGTNKNHGVSTGPLACPFALSLTPLTRSLALDCSLCLLTPLRSRRSLPRSWESELFMPQNDLVLSHSGTVGQIRPANHLKSNYVLRSTPTMEVRLKKTRLLVPSTFPSSFLYWL